MNRVLRALATLVLLAAPLSAQVVFGRKAGPIVTTTLILPAAPAAAGAVSIAPLSSLVSPLADLTAVPPAALTPGTLQEFSAASAPPKSAAAAPKPGDSQPAANAADAPLGSYGRALFDGAGELRSQHGATFVPAERSHPAISSRFALVQSALAPPAAARSVPGTDGLSGRELLKKVGQIATSNHKTREYQATIHYIFKTADHVIVGGVSGVVDAYSGVFVPGTSDNGGDYPGNGDQDGDGYPEKDGMNIEHTFPQSYFEQKLPMRSDAHHLMATFKHPNGMRQNLPYGEVTGEPDYHNEAGAKRGGGFFEPPDMTKGRVARNLLYFYARYKDAPFFGQKAAWFWNIQVETLIGWNRRFPPDTQEMHRNDLDEQYQGNRNPFIDDPGLADRIGLAALRAGSGNSRNLRSSSRRH